jgi:hypothetical protein
MPTIASLPILPTSPALLMSDAEVWEFVFGPGVPDPPPERVASDGGHEAAIGIVWVDPASAIHYEFVVNGARLGRRQVARGGRLILRVGLHTGLNRLEWSILHAGTDWRRAIYLRVNDKVTKLSEDQGLERDTGWRAGAASLHIPL